MDITPISYHEAANLLGKGYSTVRAAVARGAITRLPSVGQEQKVIKEQVLLFKGKTQLRTGILSEQALMTWHKYNQTAMASKPLAIGQDLYTPTQVAQLLASYEQERESLSPEEKKSSLPNSPNWQALPSWQALHNNMQNLNTGETWGLVILLIVLIGAYLAMRYLNKDVTLNKYVIEQNLESAKEYTDKPELVLSLVDEIAQETEDTGDIAILTIQAIKEAMAA